VIGFATPDQLDALERHLTTSARELTAAIRRVESTTWSLPPLALTTEQAAEALMTTRAVVLAAIHSGRLDASKVSGRYAIGLADLVAYENERHDRFVDRALVIAGSARSPRRTRRRRGAASVGSTSMRP